MIHNNIDYKWAFNSSPLLDGEVRKAILKTEKPSLFVAMKSTVNKEGALFLYVIKRNKGDVIPIVERVKDSKPIWAFVIKYVTYAIKNYKGTLSSTLLDTVNLRKKNLTNKVNLNDYKLLYAKLLKEEFYKEKTDKVDEKLKEIESYLYIMCNHICSIMTYYTVGCHIILHYLEKYLSVAYDNKFDNIDIKLEKFVIEYLLKEKEKLLLTSKQS